MVIKIKNKSISASKNNSLVIFIFFNYPCTFISLLELLPPFTIRGQWDVKQFDINFGPIDKSWYLK